MINSVQFQPVVFSRRKIWVAERVCTQYRTLTGWMTDGSKSQRKAPCLDAVDTTPPLAVNFYMNELTELGSLTFLKLRLGVNSNNVVHHDA